MLKNAFVNAAVTAAALAMLLAAETEAASANSDGQNNNNQQTLHSAVDILDAHRNSSKPKDTQQIVFDE
jgi:type IV secretory pathway VirB2 component (pilin)